MHEPKITGAFYDCTTKGLELPVTVWQVSRFIIEALSLGREFQAADHTASGSRKRMKS